jgi:hypothetical protein
MCVVLLLGYSRAEAQTATQRPDGGLNISCPSGRSATVIPKGSEVTIDVREKDGKTWGMSQLPSTGGSDPQNRVGDPARIADQVCKM